jgi:hypothetical protein
LEQTTEDTEDTERSQNDDYKKKGFGVDGRRLGARAVALW